MVGKLDASLRVSGEGGGIDDDGGGIVVTGCGIGTGLDVVVTAREKAVGGGIVVTESGVPLPGPNIGHQLHSP